VRLVIKASNGEIAHRGAYSAFGEPTLNTNSSLQPYSFAGGILDSGSGLISFGKRDYLPEVGRWTIKDPILFAGGDTNLYGYVLGNPVNLTDPMGLSAINCSNQPHLVKPESGPIGILPPRQEWSGSPDGVYTSPSGPWIKTPGKDWLPENEVLIHPDGSVECTGGPCRWLGWWKEEKPPDPTWVPPSNPKQLPGCKPVNPERCAGL
jgi:RHS repeat-associated protein